SRNSPVSPSAGRPYAVILTPPGEPCGAQGASLYHRHDSSGDGSYSFAAVLASVGSMGATAARRARVRRVPFATFRSVGLHPRLEGAKSYAGQSTRFPQGDRRSGGGDGDRRAGRAWRDARGGAG